MSTHIGIGFSQKEECLNAVREAATQALSQLGQERIDAAIVFNTTHYNPEEFLPAAFEALKYTKLIGASTSGILFKNKIYKQGVAVLAIYSDEIRFESSFVSHIYLKKFFQAGQDMAKQAITDFGQQQRKLLLLFSDNALSNQTLFLKGIKESFSKDFLIAGACSTSDFYLNKSYQYHKDTCMTNGAACLLLGGRPNIHLSMRHGWRPLGKPRNIDKTEANIIKTIEKKKAISLYEEYFDQESNTLSDNPLGQINIRYPLGIKIDQIDNKNKYLLRNAVGTQEDGSIVCQDAVPENSEAHIMIGTKDSCLLSAENAVRELKEQLGGKTPKLILVITSLIRYKILSREAEKEIKLISDSFGPSVPIVGMQSYGETFSVATSAKTAQTLFHNGSIMLLAFS